MIPRSADLVVGRWGARFHNRTFRVAIGKGGLRADKHEGDGASPVGIWYLRDGYWRADRDVLHSNQGRFAPIGHLDLWSDDPADPAYNQHVRATSWPYSHERLRRADRLYDLVIATDHNQDCMPGRGSAIFVHCWRSARFPTAGCIAFDKKDLRWILAHWSRSTRLIIRPR